MTPTYRKTLSIPRFFIAFLFLSLLSSFPLLALAEPSTPNDNPPLEKVRLQLKWFHQFQFAGYYAAIQQGYYAEEGLDVELLERDLNKSVANQVLDGESEYGIGDSGLLNFYAQGKPIVAMAAIFQHNPLVFITKRDSGIISAYEMKAKRIMLDVLNVDEAPLKALLTSSNISDQDFSLIKQANNNELLVKGDVDVQAGYVTDQPYYFQQHNIPINIIKPQSYGIDFYGDILFTSDNELQQHPERVERFLRASLKGWRYALDHPQQLIELIIRRYHSKLPLEHLQFEAQETQKLIPNTVPLGYIDLARLSVLADSYVKAGYSTAIDSLKLKKFVYQSALENLNLSNAEKNWLAAHPVIRVGVSPNKQPYDWVDEQGQYVGIAADYLKLLEQKLGVHFKIIKQGSNVVEIFDSIKQGELDMLTSVLITEQRSQFLNFLKPYISSRNVIFNTGQQLFTNLEQLNGKVIAVEKGYAIEEWLKRDYPAIKILEVENSLSALKHLDAQQADAYIGDIAATNYLLKKHDLSNIKVAGQTDYRSDRTIAINKQLPELSAIIYKASLTIDQQHIDDLVSHYLNLQNDQAYNKALLTRLIGLAVIILLLIISGWIIHLNKEIKLRKLLEQREQRRNNVLSMLANNETLPDILRVLCTDIESIVPDIACSILLLSDNEQHLNLVAAPSLPDFYNLAIDGLAIGPEVGCCGAAAFSGESIFIEDIHNHPNWLAFRELTQRMPYRACWSQTIKSSSVQILGTLAVYLKNHMKPEAKLAVAIKDLVNLAGLVIEKSKNDTQSKLAESVYSHSRDGIIITDKVNNIISCNAAFLVMSGYSRDEIYGKKPSIFKSGAHNDEFYSTLWSTLHETGYWSGEILNNYKNVVNSPGLHSISVIKNSHNEVERYLSIITDITEAKKQQQLLESFAYYDSLTGLPNRLLLTDRLTQFLLENNRKPQNLAVAFIDLDGFKAINDDHGHAVGDAFLVAISQNMQTAIRKNDTLGRLGGDEFIVILNLEDNFQAFQRPIQKLIAACNTPIIIKGASLQVSASIGVSLYEGKSKQDLDAATLISQADQAMYVAKQAGKNNYHIFGT